MKLQPILLSPAFRHGASTPWGGSLLKEIYHKNIPDDHTGESLEMSVIPGLPSIDSSGKTLEERIAEHPAAMVGTDVSGDFPLLLKLIDAQDRLSVQVHPDDAYAKAHENKLGKTEAWVILKAREGAQLVYGVKAGTTYESLKEASERGEGVEDLLRFVPVHAGEVFYIPSGMVHAIGAGIMLYEIQQSSDVTYRFYDWNRTDAQGNRRALHIQQALDVTRLDLQPDAAEPVQIPDPRCRREQLLDTPFFSLQRLHDCRDVPFDAQLTHFSVLTALEPGVLHLENGKKEIRFPAGQTIYIPADCEQFTLSCPLCLLSAPVHK